MRLGHLLLAIGLAGCGSAVADPITPPPANPPEPPLPETPVPDPVPVSARLTSTGRTHLLMAGESTPSDSVFLEISGTDAATASWIAASRRSWNTLSSGAGTGPGWLGWSRSTANLAPGLHLDSITVTSPGQLFPTLLLIDSLVIAPAPVPLALRVDPPSRHRSGQAGGSPIDDSVSVVLTGSGAETVVWTASSQRGYTTLLTGSGVGSGKLRWRRSLGGLAAGRQIDTLSISTTGLPSLTVLLVDTLDITATPPSGAPLPDLGPMGSLHGRRIFPDDDPWNQPVDTAQVDPNSLAILSKVGLSKSLHPDFFASYGGKPYGIPWQVVDDDVPRAFFKFQYSGESDLGPYPIPLVPVIEGDPDDGDRHMIVITRREFKLYETFYTYYRNGEWTAGSGAIFDLINGTKRPAGWTSADAAGLPVFAGLVRGDEVIDMGEIRHALRFTITNTRRAYVPPATHYASNKTDPLLPPMGMRVRLKANVDISKYCDQCQVILRALKKYGMMVADNGGDFFLNGAPDPRWDDEGINGLKKIKVSDFEVVKMVGVVTK